MAYDYYGPLLDDAVPGLTHEDVRTHVKFDDVGDDSDDEALRLYTRPAAYMIAERFLNRQVFPTQAALDAYTARWENPDDFDPDDRVTGPPKYPMVANRPFVAAVLLIIGHLYRNREDTTVENMREMPLGSRAILFPWRAAMGI